MLTTWRWTIAAALLTAICQYAISAHGKEMWEHDWVEVVSPNFVVVSALQRNRTLSYVKDLENFRSAAQILTNVGRFESRIPTKIYVLPRRAKELGFDDARAGYFFGGMRTNTAVMVSRGSFSDEILKHEYVHFLVHNRNSQLYPTWYDEGFAELLSTLVVRENVLTYGEANQGRLSWLTNVTWMPFGKLLEVRNTTTLSSDQTAMFYAQAWLLTHYLTIGQSGDAAVRFAEFLRLCEEGRPRKDAFESAFGIKLASLGPRLIKYGNRMPYYTAKLQQPFPVPKTNVRAIGTDEIAAELGLLALRVRGHEGAKPYFDAALAANPDNAAAHVGMGDVHKFSGRSAEARPFYERAIALQPDEPLHELAFAEYFLDLADASQDADQRDALLQQARHHFARSHRLDPDNPETLAMNGLSYLYPGHDAAKAVASLGAAHALLPGQRNIRHGLAKAYAANGQKEEARVHLNTLLAWAHTESAEEIRKLLDSLD